MKMELVRLVVTILLGGAVMLAILPACGGSTVPDSTSTPSPAAGPASTPTPATPAKAATATATKVAATATPTKVATSPTPAPRATSTSTPTAAGPSQVVDVEATSDPYVFIPDTFTFQTGKKYTLRFKAPKEPHTFTVTGLGLDIMILPGQVTEQVVTFNDVGRFQLVCTFHEQLKQTGTVTVTP